MDLDVEAIRENNASVIALRGEIDVYTAPLLRQKIVDLVDEGALNIVVDMERVDFLDSTGLSLLINVDRRLRSEGRRLTVVSGTGAPHRILEISGLGSHIEIVEDLDS